MIELDIYLLLSVIWPVNMKGMFLYGFTYVYICVTWERPVLTKFWTMTVGKQLIIFVASDKIRDFLELEFL